MAVPPDCRIIRFERDGVVSPFDGFADWILSRSPLRSGSLSFRPVGILVGWHGEHQPANLQAAYYNLQSAAATLPTSQGGRCGKQMATGVWCPRVGDRGDLSRSGGVGAGDVTVAAAADRVRRQHEQRRADRRNLYVDIRIDRWSTDAERKGLLTTFFEKGPDKLLDALQDAKPVGRVSAPGKLGWELRFARHEALPEGGSRIVIVTDRRWNSGRHATSRARSTIRSRSSKFGSNPTAPAKAKPRWRPRSLFNKKTQTVELENYSSEPLRLNNVKIQR